MKKLLLGTGTIVATVAPVAAVVACGEEEEVQKVTSEIESVVSNGVQTITVTLKEGFNLKDYSEVIGTKHVIGNKVVVELVKGEGKIVGKAFEVTNPPTGSIDDINKYTVVSWAMESAEHEAAKNTDPKNKELKDIFTKFIDYMNPTYT